MEPFPKIEPFHNGHLDVGDGHKIYYEESGNPHGEPVVLCHGGPGSYSKPKHRQSFDPQRFRIILFDQRGCGQSLAEDRFQNNTTWHLINDMEALRQHLGITSWHVCGGSWGSAVALCYSIKNAEYVKRITAWSIFLGDQWMLDWLGASGLGLFFPEAYAKLLANIPFPTLQERERLLNGSFEEQKRAAAYNAWEGVGNTFPTEEALVEMQTAPEDVDWQADIAYAKLFLHYEKNGLFIDEGYILKNIHKVKHIPGTIVHGRHDMCCPPKAAYDLHKAWPQATLRIVEDAAHRTQPRLLSAIMQAIHN